MKTEIHNFNEKTGTVQREKFPFLTKSANQNYQQRNILHEQPKDVPREPRNT